MSEEEKGWRPYRHSLGYSNRGPLGDSRPAPYTHHSEGAGNPRARLKDDKSLRVLFNKGTPTSFGKRIIEACPPEGIGERELIEKLNGLDAYPDFQRDIAELVKAGYLAIEDGRYKRAK